MAGMLEFVDVRPYFGLPRVIMDGTSSTGRTPGVQLLGNVPPTGRFRQFYKNAADLFDVVVFPNYVFVTQKIGKSELAGFTLGLRASMKWAIFGPQLFG